jgi:hypothetical protein
LAETSAAGPGAATPCSGGTHGKTTVKIWKRGKQNLFASGISANSSPASVVTTYRLNSSCLRTRKGICNDNISSATQPEEDNEVIS